jgi:hypothetical protein
MRARRLWWATVLGAAVSASGFALTPASASASADQLSIIQDTPRVMADPAGTLATIRALGASTVRVVVGWAQIAPARKSATPPRNFDATDPAAYPAASWAPYDAIVKLATADGIVVDFTLSGGAPRWAEGPGIPPAALYNEYWAWRPSPAAFGQFAHAVAERYNGTYVPPGETAPLPRVSFWAIWNEPNFGEDLGPQAIDGSTVPVGPAMYRSLVGQAWNALQATGHGGDTVLIGEFAPDGLSGRATPKRPGGLPGDFGQTKPLQFLRTLYCVDSAYRQLRGSAARSVGCPVTAAASRRFRASNPGLFGATGLADHPYSFHQPPTSESSRDPDIAPFPRIPNLERALDLVQQAYGSLQQLPIYNTEYGYITDPPGHGGQISPATAAYYLNWAEYLSWKQPLIASTMQYLLYDPPPVPTKQGRAGFASGLLFSSGQAKATYAAYRLPVYLPLASTRRGRTLEVWGCVRPARYALLDTGEPQTAQIQFAPRSGGGYRTLQTVLVDEFDDCYFDIRIAFPGSGNVRLSYVYPVGSLGLDGTTVYSRTVAVTLR